MKTGVSFLHSILNERGMKPSDLANMLKITPQAISGWEKDGAIPSRRLSQIASSLSLTSQQVDMLVGVEPLHFSFRTKNGDHITEDQVSERMKSRSEVTFERFFGDLKKNTYNLDNLKTDIKKCQDNFVEIANLIRTEFTIRSDAPITNEDSYSILEKLNAKAFFLPFKQIKLNVNGEIDQTAVLYSKDGAYSILVDSDRTIDEAHFDKLHEMLHIFFFDVRDQNKELEDLIDKICGELVYPKKYIVDKFFGGDENSRPSFDLKKLEENFEHEYRSRKFIISPKGLARAMRDIELTSRNSDLYKFLYSELNEKFKKNAISYSAFGKMDFEFRDRNALIDFYKNFVENPHCEYTYPLFEKLKSDFLNNYLEASDFADTFGMKLSDSLVLKAIWKKEIKEKNE
jgi:hypothetical protein